MQIMVSCLLFFLTFSCLAIPIVKRVQTFYQISGNTEQALRQQLNQLGPTVNNEHFDSKTTWHITWTYTWQFDNQLETTCSIKDVSVSVKINTLFPQWIDQYNASPALKTKWNNYLTALQIHEQEHEYNGLKAAQEIEAALLQTSSMPSCEELQTKLETTAITILKQHHIWDQQFDLETNHGKNQGAVFP
ncbi:Predicted secreted Zn-dependent protease [Legionella lansingensis]|uniref:Secreted Zn-dependent protease n=1 Tax=Legionella lansingensis TaxID=45067 RepID=A0A0W0VKH0_9GAMM|nr:DUF922 domain-containing protein [Legionella lansingensis]KTD20563.1 hypothetical protein Llan_1816 [Legionella lansingensis]SNV47777.1 Predicted secreted Zn-dependent protease [Legionella lansingensis]